MDKIELKSLINECIRELQTEGFGDFMAGGLVGYITGWATTKTKNKNLNDKVANAAINYQNSLEELKGSLEPYQGATTKEKYDSFLKDIATLSVSHLKVPKKKIRIKK